MSAHAVIHQQDAEGVLTISLPERFDFHSVTAFHDSYRSHREPSSIVIDMSSTRILDSCGMGLLLCFYDTQKAKGAELYLINCCDSIRDILTRARFHRKFKMS